MSKLLAALLVIGVLTHCTSNQPTSRNVSKEDTTTAAKELTIAAPTDTSFRLDYFATLPARIGGCGEYFTYDTSAFGKENYIFLSNLSEYAVIKVKGTDIYLTKDTAGSQSVNNSSYTAIYRGAGYTAILKMQQTKAYDEGGFYAGTLEIRGNNLKALYKIHGEAGC